MGSVSESDFSRTSGNGTLPANFHFFWCVYDGLFMPACYAENVTLEID